MEKEEGDGREGEGKGGDGVERGGGVDRCPLSLNPGYAPAVPYVALVCDVPS